MKTNAAKYRLESKKPRREVAAAIGISEQNLYLIEANKANPAMSTIIRLADFYNVTADALLGRETQQSKQPVNPPEGVN